jgi:hypothetical protein
MLIHAPAKCLLDHKVLDDGVLGGDQVLAALPAIAAFGKNTNLGNAPFLPR